jgi:hypothetical protein
VTIRDPLKVSRESEEVISEPATTIGNAVMTIRDERIVVWWPLTT